ncbi:MAG TPA: serine/threonine-protein kinase [Usitatibacter sp.]|jgi:tRNA A-37 threonylcarbamoyl transferase component Bud32|nr:serine/threonine-protein kinase [Usitatibacter sp.]
MSVHAGMPPLDATAMMPARIGAYEIRGVLGRGESATIYLGRELFPARDVAIKVYDPRLLASEERALFRSLFLKEALLAKKLTHPNITQVHDAAADDERAYIVMEYVQAGSLDRYCVAEGLLEPRRVARILEQVCDALSYANAHGIVHRDLKPANILMGADGEAKVADFGVAHTAFAFDPTRGLVVGSPAYMAPEQLERKPASIQSDMYSLGIVLYKMLMGELPFSPDTPAALMARILLGNLPKPGAGRSGLDPHFDAIFARATARDPAQRYASWEEFGADLRRISEPAGECAPDERVAQLRALPLFRDFTSPALAELAPMGRWFDVRAGSTLVGEDDPGYSFFVLVRGQMRVTRRGTLLRIHGAGQCLEETAFLRRNAARRFASVTAVTDCTVIEFDPDVLWLASPDCTRQVHEAFLRIMAERLVNAEGALAEMLAGKSVTLF